MRTSFCPHCGRSLPHRRAEQQLEAEEAPSLLEGPPSPKGTYAWAGRQRLYDYRRIVRFLGKRRDAELARLISAPPTNVRWLRERLGIAPYHPLRGFEKLIGKLPDNEVARRAGCHPVTVASYRKRHGIPRAPRGSGAADRRLKAYVEELAQLFER